MPLTPHYENGVLTVGKLEILRFDCDVPNPMAVLDAFQKLGWPREVKYVLDKVLNAKSRTRLRDTVTRLNGVQKLVLFHRREIDLAIIWELRFQGK